MARERIVGAPWTPLARRRNVVEDFLYGISTEISKLQIASMSYKDWAEDRRMIVYLILERHEDQTMDGG